MTYDRDGRRARRLQAIRLATAVAVGMVIPLAVTAFSYVG
jgi:hypothetical protein